MNFGNNSQKFIFDDSQLQDPDSQFDFGFGDSQNNFGGIFDELSEIAIEQYENNNNNNNIVIDNNNNNNKNKNQLIKRKNIINTEIIPDSQKGSLDFIDYDENSQIDFLNTQKEYTINSNFLGNSIDNSQIDFGLDQDKNTQNDLSSFSSSSSQTTSSSSSQSPSNTIILNNNNNIIPLFSDDSDSGSSQDLSIYNNNSQDELYWKIGMKSISENFNKYFIFSYFYVSYIEHDPNRDSDLIFGIKFEPNKVITAYINLEYGNNGIGLQLNFSITGDVDMNTIQPIEGINIINYIIYKVSPSIIEYQNLCLYCSPKLSYEYFSLNKFYRSNEKNKGLIKNIDDIDYTIIFKEMKVKLRTETIINSIKVFVFSVDSLENRIVVRSIYPNYFIFVKYFKDKDVDLPDELNLDYEIATKNDRCICVKKLILLSLSKSIMELFSHRLPRDLIKSNNQQTIFKVPIQFNFIESNPTKENFLFYNDKIRYILKDLSDFLFCEIFPYLPYCQGMILPRGGIQLTDSKNVKIAQFDNSTKSVIINVNTLKGSNFVFYEQNVIRDTNDIEYNSSKFEKLLKSASLYNSFDNNLEKDYELKYAIIKSYLISVSGISIPLTNNSIEVICKTLLFKYIISHLYFDFDDALSLFELFSIDDSLNEPFRKNNYFIETYRKQLSIIGKSGTWTNRKNLEQILLQNDKTTINYPIDFNSENSTNIYTITYNQIFGSGKNIDLLKYLETFDDLNNFLGSFSRLDKSRQIFKYLFFSDFSRYMINLNYKNLTYSNDNVFKLFKGSSLSMLPRSLLKTKYDYSSDVITKSVRISSIDRLFKPVSQSNNKPISIIKRKNNQQNSLGGVSKKKQKRNNIIKSEYPSSKEINEYLSFLKIEEKKTN